MSVPSSGHAPLAAELIETARAMERKGINNGTAGNVSARVGDGMLVTPSGVPYDQVTVGHVIHMNFDTSWRALGATEDTALGATEDTALGATEETALGSPRPSSEWRFHLDILQARPEVNAVVHAHPTAATALSTHSRGIGPFHYMVGVAGGEDIRCAEYATFGTEELSRNALRALEQRKACLLAHHGILAVGADLAGALALAVEVEVLAGQYLAALAIGEPPQLTSEQMGAVLDKMASPDGYGSSPAPDA
ncbi:MAG: class II aldolase/adducin family protein [Acidimicrobiales bacterium]